jgi:hypothetical protein
MSQSLFLGQNLVITDTPKNSGFTSNIDATDTSITNASLISTNALNLAAKGIVNFNGDVLLNVGNGVNLTDGINLQQLTNEAARAITAESTLTNNLIIEAKRATSAENIVTNNLSNEITRSTTADATLTANLASEINRATASDASLLALTTALTTALANETSRANAAESALTVALGNEIARAKAAENAITSSINQLSMYFFNSNTIPIRSNKSTSVSSTPNAQKNV